MTSEIALQVDNLKKSYGNFMALKGVSFAVQTGEVFGLLGPNGAGKSTLIEIVTSLEQADSGQVKVFGVDALSDRIAAKRLMGVVHQEVVQSGYFTTTEILEFQMGYYGQRVDSARIKEVLERLHLMDHRHKKVKALSGGMKRRLMIAKALLHKPKLLLLDEPTAGVDVELRKILWSLVRELREEGVSILLTTHYLEEAERLCDRVGVLHHGQVLWSGKTQDAVANFSRKTLDIRLHSRAVAKMVDLGSQIPPNSELRLKRLEAPVGEVVVPMSWSLGESLAQLQLSVSDIEDLHVKEGNLEDAFSLLTSGEAGLAEAPPKSALFGGGL